MKNDDLKNIREAEEFIHDLKSYRADEYFKKIAARYSEEVGAEYLEEAELLAEENEIDEFASLRLDAKIKSRIMRENATVVKRKNFGGWGALAASVVILTFVATYFILDRLDETQQHNEGEVLGAYDIVDDDEDMRNVSQMEDADYVEAVDEVIVDTPYDLPFELEAENEADIVTLSVPRGWDILSADDSGNTAIFHIQTAAGNYINALVLAGDHIYDPAQGQGFIEMEIGETLVSYRVEETHSILFFNLGTSQIVLSTTYDYSELIELVKYWLE